MYWVVEININIYVNKNGLKQQNGPAFASVPKFVKNVFLEVSFKLVDEQSFHGIFCSA